MPTAVSIDNVVERQLWTADDFLGWLEPGIHADLIDGEKFMHSPVNLRHARLLNFMDHLMRSYLAFFTNEQVAGLRHTHAPFAPTLVVEALSPNTADRDVGPKFAAYEEHGVQEYWVLDPETLAHRFYRREGELLVEFGHGEEVIRAQTVPGFWLKRCWPNPEQLPQVAACLDGILGPQS